jgi:Fe-S cluster biogenesis protein NfuA
MLAMRGGRKPRRRDRTIGSMPLLTVLLTAIGMLIAITPAHAATPELILGRPRIGEFQPVRGDGYLAWQQNTKKRPGHYDVFARPLDGGAHFKVNARGTSGANGDISGGNLVYQEFRRGRSDIRLFDLNARDRSAPPSDVNTKHWEYWPSMSGDRLLFGRLYGNGSRSIFLFDLSTGNSTKLARTTGRDSFLAPGQVNGDYVVWYRCFPNETCEVTRYHIPDGASDVIADTSPRQRSPSVAPDGTVYYVRSGVECGNRVRLIRQPLQGPEEILWRVSGGDDVGTSRVSVGPDGEATMLFDNYDCDRAAESDAWQILQEGAPQLSVKVEGDGNGTVTSSPAGINCGSDCSETYDRGTGVTLTASAQGSSVFAGWGGACTGNASTCTVTMDGSKSVTATFTTKPVLNVSKAGTGNGVVTSSPSGINCGTDCLEPYDAGTNVTLTATPASGSVFVEWTGACGTTSSTCQVNMNGSKSVTATFTPKPVLNVSKTGTGDGVVTSSPSGIDCGTDCVEPYDAGTNVTLTAAPASGSVFVEWTGACVGNASTCEVNMNASKTVTAAFDLVPQFTLDVVVTGSGSVAGNGISCPGTCSQQYAPGTPISLTATYDPLAVILDWGGDCEGELTDTCAFTMDSNKNVSATFVSIP